MAKPALGRGLEALLKTKVPSQVPVSPQAVTSTTPPPTQEGIVYLPIDRIRQSSLQPRKEFPEEALRELAESIRTHGLMQPVIVRAKGDFYELIAGERRWRAAQMCGLQTIPALIKQFDDKTALEVSLIENLQRQDLNPVEEALGYATLMEQFGLTQEEIASQVGKSRAAVANSLRLLKLPPVIQEYLRTGRLTVGHAKAILGIEDQALQIQVANRVIKENLNVRQTERIVSLIKGGKKPLRASNQHTSTSPFINAIETKLRQHLGTRVDIRYSKGQGTLTIHFYSDEDLTRLLQTIGINIE